MLVTRSAIRLPNLQPYNPFEEAEPPIIAEDNHLDELLHRLVKYLSTRFQKWKMDSEFSFDLPESQFDHKRDKPIITYLQPDAVQDEGMVGPLTVEQLQGIRSVGIFTVSSRRYAIPYKWKISEWFQRGSQQIRLDLYYGLGSVFMTLYELRCVMDVRQQIRGIWQNILHIGMLYIGLKSTNIHTDTQKILYELEKQRQKEAFKNHTGRFSLALAEYLDIPIDLKGDALEERRVLVQKRVQELNQLPGELINLWNTQKERIIEELEDKYPTERLKDEVERLQHELFVKLVMDKAHLDEDVRKQLIQLVEQYNIISQIQSERTRRFSESITNISKQIVKDFPIRRHCQKWFSLIYSRFEQEVTKREEEWMFDQLRRRLSTVYFEDYVSHCRSYDKEYKQVEQRLGSTVTATGYFTESYGIFPPYKLDYNAQSATYSIETVKRRTVDTSKNFWKLTLLWVRLVCGFRAMFYLLVRNIWVGSLGIRVLLERRKFYPEYIVNSTTGEIGRSASGERTPVYLSICRNLSSIRRLRQSFESAPNSGLFDKRTARVFHLLYCYLNIFFLRVVIYYCLLKPVFILLNIAVSLVLIVGMPLWLPAFTVLQYSANIHLNNFDHPNPYNSYGRVQWFPFARFMLRAIFTLLLIVLKLTVVLLILLAMAGLTFIWSASRYACRTAYDAVLYQLIKTIGRSPVTDSSVAWKIAGPGITGSYYQSIKSTDIYLLVTAQLEKIHLEMFRVEITNLLMRPQTQADKIGGLVINRLKGGSLQYYKIFQSINYYTSKIYKQIQQRIGVFPSSPGQNVRFTEEEMLSFTKITKEIFSRYRERNPGLNMFEYLGIRKMNENKLVKAIWQRIFQNKQVFSMLDLDQVRFDVMKEQQEDDDAGHLADRIRAGVTNSDIKEGISASVFSALDSEDQLLAIFPKDCNVSQVVNNVRRCTSNNLPSSKADIYLSIILNPNIPRME